MCNNLYIINILTKNEMKKEKVLQICKQKNVRFVNLQFCDLLGFVKSVTIPVSKLGDAIDEGMWFDGSSIEGFTRIFESDMYLKLDLKTFSVVPWQGSKTEGERVARVICDVHLPDGTPFEGDPRHILKRQVERAKKMGLEYYVGPELEFFLFKKAEDGSNTVEPNDRAGYFDFSSDRAGAVRAAMSKTVSEMGIDVEAIHHEVAEGQHEIDFKYSDAVTQADAVVTVKAALRAVAEDFGLHATFMPKPISGVNGSGMHVHQSMFKKGKNAFFDAKGTHHLSKTAEHFFAGQLKRIHEFVAVTNPLINSYKRLVPGYEAPVYVAWGQTNRSAMIRIPQYRKGKEEAVRGELRNPDASANPYLAFAVMLAAGLDGIEQKLEAPNPINENIYEFTQKKAERMRVKTLPGSLDEAVKKMEKSEFVKEVFGEHSFLKFVEAKKIEVDGYRLQVSEWELNNYLDIY
jgi:glutamine synthetase